MARTHPSWGAIEPGRAEQLAQHGSPEEKAGAIKDLIRKTSATAGVTALQPIPVLDVAILTPIQRRMARSIGLIRGYRLDDVHLKRMFRAVRRPIVMCQTMIAVVKACKFIPWPGADITQFCLAYALTYAIGQMSDEHLSHPDIPADELKSRLTELTKKSFSATLKSKREELHASLHDEETRRQFKELRKARRERKIDDEELARSLDGILARAGGGRPPSAARDLPHKPVRRRDHAMTTGTNQPKRLAVVTGASSGIGYELARQFALHNYDLLIAAEDDGIDTAARELESILDVGKVRAAVAKVDLSKSEGIDALCARIERDGRPVEAIAINAGVGVGGDFVRETKLEDELDLIRLNVISTVCIAKRILPAMVKRGRGRVLFTASIAGIMPTPFEAVYGASKAFILESPRMGPRPAPRSARQYVGPQHLEHGIAARFAPSWQKHRHVPRCCDRRTSLGRRPASGSATPSGDCLLTARALPSPTPSPPRHSCLALNRASACP